jgi:hypothetical protein
MTWRRAHLALTLIWLTLGVPSILWWKDSVPYVVLMSWYAIVASHLAGWQASKAEDAASPDIG